MRKHCLKRTLALIMCLACLLTLLASCKGTPDGSGESSLGTEEAEQNFYKDYTVIIPTSVSDELRAESELLAKLIGAYTGATVRIFEDGFHAYEEGAKEILIGKTNRADSSSLALPASGYAIKMEDDGTILIGGTTDAIICDAVAYYAHNILYKGEKSGTQIISAGYSYTSEYQNVTLGSSYTVVYSDKLDDDSNSTYANNGVDYEVGFATTLAEKLKEKGISANVTSDKAAPVANEILIGETNRAESISFYDSMGYSQYGIGYENGKITVGGHAVATTMKACEELVVKLDKGTTLTLGKASLCSNHDWTVNFPVYEGGKVSGVSESYYDGMILYITDTTRAEYDAYCGKLESAGYERIMSNEIDSNVFAAYETDKVSVYVYFVPSDNSVRLIAANANDVEFPESAYDPYYKVTDVSITQMQLDFGTNAGGMGYIITLEDGSFIMIDSGSTTSSSASAAGKENLDHVRMWNLLNKLNKRKDGKIIIRAWIITHCHADHIQVFEKFCKNYGSKVTIEKYYECVVPKSVCYNGKNPDYRVINGNVDKANGYVTDGFDMVMLHTGMHFSMYGAEFDILYTVEDLYPTRLDYFNNASTTFKLTAGGTSVLITGDIYTDASNVLVRRYPTALKSDIVQISHHANQGATKAFYEAVDPTVALWPTSEKLFAQMTSEDGRTPHIIINRYVYTQMNVKENYTNSDYSVELKLPYVLGSAKKHIVSTTDQYK
ncbi:MAG: MBL fold metallo-hydrolase [Clostridia bacterium]|nr:MBL fold metallo-hydrolase [Clostridia bacterium]